MFVKDNFGNVAEAFNLIMRKENMYPIIAGTKKIEYRDVSDRTDKKDCDRYASMFFKSWRIKDRDKADYLVPKEIGCVHFHDYGNTWFADCSIEAIDIVAVHYQNEAYFHEHGHHEWDELFAKQRAEKIDDPHDKSVKWYYCLPITGLINTNLDLSGIPNVYAYSIPEDCIITDPDVLAKAEAQFRGEK